MDFTVDPSKPDEQCPVLEVWSLEYSVELSKWYARVGAKETTGEILVIGRGSARSMEGALSNACDAWKQAWRNKHGDTPW